MNNQSNLAAKILFDHRMNKKGMKSLPKSLIPESIEEAYKIQDELKLLYLSLKDNYCIGKKNGCTNSVAQKQINIFEPFYGNLFSKYSNISGCTLKSTNFYKHYIEPEISFRLKSDININEAPFNFDDSSKIFDGILPSIEIVDFRFGENIKEVGIKNLIVTNGASEYWIRGNTIFDQNIIHGSESNNSSEDRLLLAFRYITPDNTTEMNHKSASLICGEDSFGFYQKEPIPKEDFQEDCLKFHGKLMSNQAAIFGKSKLEKFNLGFVSPVIKSDFVRGLYYKYLK